MPTYLRRRFKRKDTEVRDDEDNYEKKTHNNMPTYSRRRLKRKNTEVNDDEHYYEKKEHTTCLPT